ncbi:MAG TPA: glycosyltransferase [Puia sp.]|nr:glycosyltransferase [Puia sp.]
MKATIIIIGPGYPLRGGLATFDHRLAKEFLSQGYHCSIYSYSLQYPSVLFPGSTQYSSDPAPQGLEIFSKINSINPLNWLRVGKELKKLRPDILVVRYWLPFMAPSLGTILRRVQKNKHTRIIAITDNVLPHEKGPLDKSLTKYFLESCDAFITMSERVMNDLRKLEKNKPARKVFHPLYDNFGEPVSKQAARERLGIKMEDKVILFFGFIRKYKGLDLLLSAIKLLRDDESNPYIRDVKLLIAGEYYEDEKLYSAQIDRLGIRDSLILHTRFIPDSEVKYFLGAADLVVQPYRNATQSGVTPLAYYFEKPMIVSNVGGLPSLVPHEKAGLVASPDPESLAKAIVRYYELGENYFIHHLRSEKQKYSWDNLVKTIIDLAYDLQK